MVTKTYFSLQRKHREQGAAGSVVGLVTTGFGSAGPLPGSDCGGEHVHISKRIHFQPPCPVQGPPRNVTRNS